jgi:succinyl-CoA synthetase alpha subunit
MINPRISRSTPVIMQGITGRAGQSHFRLMRAYGTNIVGGVSPRSTGGDIDGVPLYATCAEAVAKTGARASIMFVGADQLLAAIEEVLAAGVELIVTPTEGMPVHDALKAKRLTLEKGVAWIGPSTPGLAVPGEAKLGFLPDTTLAPGPLGIMSKSGTLSYESGFRLVQKGIGQSVWVGVGGDPVKGIRFADLVPFYAADAQTEAVLIIGEIGGAEEEEFARAITMHGFSKPAFALIAGRSAPEGVNMGHAGALVHGAHGTYAAKKAALEAAGVRVFGSLEEMTRGVVAALGR